MSGHDLARAVNQAGREAGLHLIYDRSAVSRWLAGTCPGPPVPALVCEVLSRALGRTVTPRDARLARATTRAARPAGDDARADVAGLLAQLGPGHDSRHGPAPVYSLTLSLPPEYSTTSDGPRDGVASIRGGAPDATGRAQLGAHHVQAAEDLLTTLRASEESSGGQLVRPAVTGLLAVVAPGWLRASASPRIHRRLLTVTARLSLLAGYTCFDGGTHGTAQLYYRAAAELAVQAANPQGHASALRAMSMQAHCLGHHGHAQDLADAAAQHNATLPSREVASVLGRQAIAAAATGDRQQALAHLAEARRLIDHSPLPDSRAPQHHWAAYFHHEADTLTALGDKPAALSALRQSLDSRPDRERRARAVTTAKMAEILLSTGQLDRACATWQSLLDDYPLLASGRILTAVATMVASLTPHATHPRARALLARADHLGIAIPGRNPRHHTTR
ncbi:tol-pal system YbgF family protein [Kitasatospora sp. NPDC008050]|uniref:tetratricopeptide repeat protein n=1 Tax=Kitasatospora sp. NPDC008050 TaxID=3364021 RepID=UPI0036E3B3E9